LRGDIALLQAKKKKKKEEIKAYKEIKGLFKIEESY
jgi:hypothetical protein